MQRVGILNGENITYDKDLSQYFLSLANSGIISGLEVQDGAVKAGKAIIKVARTNGEEVAVVFELTEDLTVDTTGDKKVFIEINQVNIDDGTNNNEDGTGIGEIKIATSYPSSNYLSLASIVAGVITDERVFVKINESILNGANAGKLSFDNLTKDITTTGKVTANEFEGNGSKLTNITAKAFIFGDGSDGDLTLNDGDILKLTAGKTYNYNNLIINSGAKIICDSGEGAVGIKVMGKAIIDGDIDITGSISANTNNIFNLNLKYGISGNGGYGGGGGDSSTKSGGNGGYTDNIYGGGGGGGSGSGGNTDHGGNGGNGGTPPGNGGGYGQNGGISAGGGGGYRKGGGGGNGYSENGGDGGDKNSGGGGGGGGEGKIGSPFIGLYVFEINGNGSIIANGINGDRGGNGGNGGNSRTGGGGGGGGGGGSGGGAILCVYKINNSSLNYSVSGGVGGAGGIGGTGDENNGKNGKNGKNGTDGTYLIKNIKDLM